MTARTEIERIIGRELERERIAELVHFAPGQIHAEPIDDQDPPAAKLSFVDHIGRAWLLLCIRRREQWWVVNAIAGAQTFVRETDPPPLNLRLLEALNQTLVKGGTQA